MYIPYVNAPLFPESFTIILFVYQMFLYVYL